MVRVNTSLLLAGHIEKSRPIIIPSSPPVPSVQSRRRSTPDDFQDHDDPADDSVILVSSTPEFSSAQLPINENTGHGSQKAKNILDDEKWTFPGSPEPPKASPPKAKNDAPAKPEPALKRRQHWTPPPADTIEIHSDTSSAAVEAWSSPRKEPQQKRQQDVFRNLHDSFSCKDDAKRGKSDSRPTSHPADETTAFSRRKEIELVSVGEGGPKSVSPPKAKTSKRKARTITELAVAAYMTDDNTTDGDAATSNTNPLGAIEAPVPAKRGRVLASSRAKAAVINPGLPLTKSRKGIKARPKEKIAKHGAGAAGRKGKAAEQRALLSPQSARAESAGQDFLFGTSSQLAGNESPTFLRSLQLAMQASNRPDGDADGDVDTDAEVVDLTSFTTLESRGRRRLWMVGARMDGRLTTDNVIDLEEDISFPVDPDSVVRAGQDGQKATGVAATQAVLKSALGTPLGIQAQEAMPERAETVEMGGMCKRRPEQVPMPSPERPVMPPPGKKRSANVPARETSQADAPRMTAPDLEALATADLAEQLSSYGYKPIRDRKAMTSVLSQCRAAQTAQTTQASSGSLSAVRAHHTASQEKSAESGKIGKVGKPGKAGKTGQTGQTGKKERARRVLEIEDSESDGRFSSDASASSADSSDEQVEEDLEMSLTATLTGEEAKLFQLITAAVAAQPRTRDPARPSWHEKMLMYDTIILKTFAEWLNEGALAQTGYTGGVVDELQVKRWCESKSICCSSMQTSRGGWRKL